MEEVLNEAVERYVDKYIEEHDPNDEVDSYDAMLRFAKYVINQFILETNHAPQL